MNSDLLKRITDAMRASALAVLERKLPGAVGPIECAVLADEIALNSAQVVTSFIDTDADNRAPEIASAVIKAYFADTDGSTTAHERVTGAIKKGGQS